MQFSVIRAESVRMERSNRTWDKVPASSIPTSQRSQEWCQRLFSYADPQTLSEMGFSCGVERHQRDDFSVPVYMTVDATESRTLWRGGGRDNFGEPRGIQIPWSRKWRVGAEGKVVILSQDGSEWDLTGATLSPGLLDRLRSSLDAENRQAGYRGGGNVILASSVSHSDPTEGNQGGSAVGAFSKGLVQPSEIRMRRLSHALRMATSPNSRMTGPEAPSWMGVEHREIGTRYGCAVSPCAEFRSRELRGDLNLTVPDGSRFQLLLTRTEILSRLAANGMSGKTLDTASVLAQGLVDYGFFIEGSERQRAAIVADGSSPTEWRELGVDETTTDVMLRGLILSPLDIRCLEPPVSLLRSGVQTQRSGPASQVFYP